MAIYVIDITFHTMHNLTLVSLTGPKLYVIYVFWKNIITWKFKVTISLFLQLFVRVLSLN